MWSIAKIVPKIKINLSPIPLILYAWSNMWEGSTQYNHQTFTQWSFQIKYIFRVDKIPNQNLFSTIMQQRKREESTTIFHTTFHQTSSLFNRVSFNKAKSKAKPFSKTSKQEKSFNPNSHLNLIEGRPIKSWDQPLKEEDVASSKGKSSEYSRDVNFKEVQLYEHHWSMHLNQSNKTRWWLVRWRWCKPFSAWSIVLSGFKTGYGHGHAPTSLRIRQC